MKKRVKWTAVAVIGGGLLLPLGSFSTASAAEFGDNSAYYEDDAWYDVSEWMDGNDYNPTDEAWHRWDDETYHASQDTSGDRDSDFGYNDNNRTDWFYDHYTPHTYTTYGAGSNNVTGDANSTGQANRTGDNQSGANQRADRAGNNQSGAKQSGNQQAGQAGANQSGGRSGGSVTAVYYDYDKDRMYDAVSFSSDNDGDGRADHVDLMFFSDAGKSNQQQQSGALRAGGQPISGKIEKMKEVKVRGAQHTVVQLSPQQGQGEQGQQAQQDQPTIIELGRTDNIRSLNLKPGQQITVRGARTQIGDKQVLLATSLQHDGQTQQIDRQRQQLQGKVLSTKKAKVRGSEHLIAMVEIQPSAQRDQQQQQQENQQQQKNQQQAGQAMKCAVDLGPADKLQANVTQGSQLTFTGVPVKVKNRKLIMAQSIKQGDRFVQIDRMQQRRAGEAQPAAASQEPETQKQQNQQGQNQQSQDQQGQTRQQQQ